MMAGDAWKRRRQVKERNAACRISGGAGIVAAIIE
jgi:hypothetical protein